LQNAIDTYPDGIVIYARFQRFIELRDGQGGIPPEEPLKVILRISRNDRLQDRFPVIRTVHIAGTQSASFKMTKLIENEPALPDSISSFCALDAYSGIIRHPIPITSGTLFQHHPAGDSGVSVTL
jgi:hypothetical protein